MRLVHTCHALLYVGQSLSEKNVLNNYYATPCVPVQKFVLWLFTEIAWTWTFTNTHIMVFCMCHTHTFNRKPRKRFRFDIRRNWIAFPSKCHEHMANKRNGVYISFKQPPCDSSCWFFFYLEFRINSLQSATFIAKCNLHQPYRYLTLSSIRHNFIIICFSALFTVCNLFLIRWNCKMKHEFRIVEIRRLFHSNFPIPFKIVCLCFVYPKRLQDWMRVNWNSRNRNYQMKLWIRFRNYLDQNNI